MVRPLCGGSNTQNTHWYVWPPAPKYSTRAVSEDCLIVTPYSVHVVL